jgi:hypothetical protein
MGISLKYTPFSPGSPLFQCHIWIVWHPLNSWFFFRGLTIGYLQWKGHFKRGTWGSKKIKDPRIPLNFHTNPYINPMASSDERTSALLDNHWFLTWAKNAPNWLAQKAIQNGIYSVCVYYIHILCPIDYIYIYYIIMSYRLYIHILCPIDYIYILCTIDYIYILCTIDYIYIYYVL